MLTSETQTQSSLLYRRIYGTVGLTLLVGFYLLFGLTGHDPWRGDDIRYLGPIHSLLQGDWLLFPQLAGEPFLEYPPLYYWCAALLSSLTGWLLDIHEGARLASVAFVALTVYCVARAAERLYGRPTRTPAALLVLGCLGLVLHSHETQPLIALMATIAVVLAGVARIPETPLAGNLQAGLGCALAVLAGGLPGLLYTLPLFAIAVMTSPECRDPRASGGLVAGLTLAVVVGGLWPLALLLDQPDLFAVWRHDQWQLIAGRDFSFDDFAKFIELLGWFMWPLWPLAFWALWRERRRLVQLRWLLPLVSAAITLALMLFSTDHSQASVLPLVPALALLAAGGVPTLRRGAANAFDWFAAMTFGVFAILVWIAWTAQVFAWPRGLARHIARVAPTFTLDHSVVLPTLIGIFICALWFLLAWFLPRKPGRGVVKWALGMTMLWCLAVTLLMPWFDHSRSYRQMGEALKKELVAYPNECVAAEPMPNSIRAMLDYHVGLRTVPFDDDARPPPCRLLLIYADRKSAEPGEIVDWEPLWVFRRGGGRQFESLHLYGVQHHG